MAGKQGPAQFQHLLLKETQTENWISPAIVAVTSGAAALLPLLRRYQLTGGEGVVDQVFVVSLMFAFSCAFSAMFLIYKKPKAARVLNISALVSTSSAFAIFLSAIFR